MLGENISAPGANWLPSSLLSILLSLTAVMVELNGLLFGGNILTM